ncbi:MAG: T9SS type A sorting domain-containing protein [Bacteroidales bacterium]|nr:T9SS type A sorting domain-containing protein [Bacteroidales bacterium]
MKKLKFLLVMFAIIPVISLMGQAETDVSITFYDGSEAVYTVDTENGSLYFEDNNMVVSYGDGLSETISLAGIRNIRFETVPFGIETIEVQENRIYPNPVSTSLYISDIETVSSVTIFSLNGHIVYKSDHNPQSSIDVSFLQRGMYLIKIDENIFKFCKQ